MALPSLSLVRLISDAYRDRGVNAGDIGVILEVYGDGAYEVEFSRADGTTIAWFAVSQHEIEPVAESAEIPSTSTRP